MPDSAARTGNGGRSSSGCSYCAGNGSRAPYLPQGGRCAPGGIGSTGSTFDAGELARQVRGAWRSSAHATPPRHSSCSSRPTRTRTRPWTSSPPVYDAGLALAPFRGLNVATRPDCLDEEKARLLASYRDRGLEVWVELGLQSADDRDPRADRPRAHGGGVPPRVPPPEGRTASRWGCTSSSGCPARASRTSWRPWPLSRLSPDGVKIHNLLVHSGLAAGTAECSWARSPRPRRRATSNTRLQPSSGCRRETVIMRLTCDTPPADARRPAAVLVQGGVHVAGWRLRDARPRGARQGRLYASA